MSFESRNDPISSECSKMFGRVRGDRYNLGMDSIGRAGSIGKSASSTVR